jgi:hypothetical protein
VCADQPQTLSHARIHECTGRKSKREPAVDEGAYLSWDNLNYSVFVRKGLKKTELQLIHDVSGYVKPGMMLALMVRTTSADSTS